MTAFFRRNALSQLNYSICRECFTKFHIGFGSLMKIPFPEKITPAQQERKENSVVVKD
jgi:hypothetical protein